MVLCIGKENISGMGSVVPSSLGTGTSDVLAFSSTTIAAWLKAKLQSMRICNVLACTSHSVMVPVFGKFDVALAVLVTEGKRPALRLILCCEIQGLAVEIVSLAGASAAGPALRTMV